jgi:hypothetical protein
MRNVKFRIIVLSSPPEVTQHIAHTFTLLKLYQNKMRIHVSTVILRTRVNRVCLQVKYGLSSTEVLKQCPPPGGAPLVL